jgi:hypothetical protein
MSDKEKEELEEASPMEEDEDEVEMVRREKNVSCPAWSSRCWENALALSSA